MVCFSPGHKSSRHDSLQLQVKEYYNMYMQLSREY